MNKNVIYLALLKKENYKFFCHTKIYIKLVNVNFQQKYFNIS